MSVTGFEDMGKPLNEEPTLRRWAAATQERNLENLANANFDGPPAIQHNAKYTIRRKGFDAPGYGKTGELAQGLTDPNAVNIRVGGSEAEAIVHAGPGTTDMKVNIFLKGQTQPRRVVVLTSKDGKTRQKVEREVTVPGRDFIQTDGREAEEAVKDGLSEIFHQWGFREV